MMNNRTLRSPGLEGYIKRDHSPYCESTGPIIQEGLVAQRIRALQELQIHALAGNRSHSPMIPCPPRWIRSYESLGPPRSARALRPIDMVPTISEYKAVKHHWSSMTGRIQENKVDGINRKTATNVDVRSIHDPTERIEPREPHGVTNKAVQDVRPSTSTSSDHFEGYHYHLGHTKTTWNADLTVEKAAKGREIQTEQQDILPADISESDGAIIKHPTTNKDTMHPELGIRPTESAKGFTTTEMDSHSSQDVDTVERHSAPNRNTRYIDSVIEAPANDQERESDKAHIVSDISVQSSGSALDAYAGSKIGELDEAQSPDSRASQNFGNGASIPPTGHASRSSEREILGPNPVPAGLADPSVLSRCISPQKPWENNQDHGNNYEQTSQLPRKSVADKLGVLVERGWVGCDVFGRAPSQRIDSDSVSTQTHGDREDSQRVSSEHEASHLSPPFYRVRSSGSSSKDGSKSHGCSKLDASSLDKAMSKAPSDEAIPLPRALERKETHSSPRKSLIERNSSDLGLGSLEASPMGKHKREYRHRKTNSEGIEMCSLPQDYIATSREGFHPSRSLSQHTVGSGPNPDDVSPGHEQERLFYTNASVAPNSRRSSTSRNDYVQSSSRSTSWLRKSWLKSLLGDRQSILEDEPSNVHPTSSAVSNGKDCASRSKRVSEITGTAHSLSKIGQDGKSEDATTSAHPMLMPGEGRSTIKGTAATSTNKEYLPGTRHGLNIADHVRMLPALPPDCPSQAANNGNLVQLRELPNNEYLQSPSEQYRKLTASDPITLPSRRSSRRATATPSKSASPASKTSGDSLDSSRGRPLLTSQHSRNIPRTSSTSVLVRIHRANRHTSTPAGHARRTPRSGSRAEQLQQQAPDKEAATSGLGGGKALKKIQVIISFDGAEDLVVEATSAGDTVQGSWKCQDCKFGS